MTTSRGTISPSGRGAAIASTCSASWGMCSWRKSWRAAPYATAQWMGRCRPPRARASSIAPVHAQAADPR
eukprot:12684436-Alexandrium_andersonii.AAC.1